jgi:hypothetical protein
MSKEEKTRVEITNRPSNKHRHTSGEWSEHIGLREASETKQDIIDARKRLGQFTARFVIEAMCAGERDGAELARRMLEYVDGDQRIDEMDVDPRALRKLADTVGGSKARHVVQHSVLREIEETEVVSKEAPISDKQVELLRALLKTMDPEVVKRALTGG